jgi:hypothetical protein
LRSLVPRSTEIDNDEDDEDDGEGDMYKTNKTNEGEENCGWEEKMLGNKEKDRQEKSGRIVIAVSICGRGSRTALTRGVKKTERRVGREGGRQR